METTNDLTNLLICVDCGMLVANGEPNPEWSDKEYSDHLIAMEESFPSDRWAVVMGDSDDDHEFSWSQCDLCSSHLGGYRFAAAAWEK